MERERNTSGMCGSANLFAYVSGAYGDRGTLVYPIRLGAARIRLKMVDIKRSIQRLVPQYRVMTSASACSCHIDDDCDCMPSLYLTERGCTGYGAAHWTYTDETCPREIDAYGKAYWCAFLGLEPFWAMGDNDAGETLRNRLDMAGIPANIDGVNNKRAEALIAELNSK